MALEPDPLPFKHGVTALALHTQVTNTQSSRDRKQVRSKTQPTERHGLRPGLTPQIEGFPDGALRYHSSTVVGRSLKAKNPGPSVESRKLSVSCAVASGANGKTTRTAIPQR